MPDIDYVSLAQDVYDEVVELRHQLHMFPELSGQEHRTLALISERLKAMDIPYVQYSNGGICGIIGHGSQAVGIRADIDALPITEATGLPFASKNPGVMHACGHDIHTAILLGLAIILKRLEHRLACPVKLFFQPAEETVGGAKVMIDEGCMRAPDVKAVLAAHVDPCTPLGAVSFLPGEMNAAVIDLSINVHGKSCHGAHPEQGKDSIVAAANIITALQTISSRLTSPTTPVVVTIGTIEGGRSGNIVSGDVTMTGTVRVLDPDTGIFVKEHLTHIVNSIAAAWGCDADVELKDDYPALINDAKLTDLMINTACGLLGSENVVLLKTPSMGADDFAYFSSAAPGCYFNIGTALPGQKSQALHSEYFSPSDECLLTGMALISSAVFNIMEEMK